MKSEGELQVELIQVDGPLTHSFKHGERVEVGRSEGSALVVKHSSVSRSHAVLEWLPATPYPVVLDRGSANGTTLDGRRLPSQQSAVFGSGSVLGFGEVEFVARLQGMVETTPAVGAPALVEDTNRFVTLQLGHQESVLSGELPEWEDVRNLLLRLEEEQRTGTLELRLSDESVRVMVLMGSMRLDRDESLSLLRRVREHEGSVGYHYVSEVEVGTLGARWNWRPSELISLVEDEDEDDTDVSRTRRVPR